MLNYGKCSPTRLCISVGGTKRSKLCFNLFDKVSKLICGTWTEESTDSVSHSDYCG